MKKILITGTNAFIRSAICKKFLEAGYSVRGLVRKLEHTNLPQHERLEIMSIGSVSRGTDWSEVLNRVDVVIHTAAHVHKFKESNPAGARIDSSHIGQDLQWTPPYDVDAGLAEMCAEELKK